MLDCKEEEMAECLAFSEELNLSILVSDFFFFSVFQMTSFKNEATKTTWPT